MASRARDLRVDLVLAAGDLSWGYLEELASLIDAPAAFVPGNHDPTTSKGPSGWLNLDRVALQLSGLRVAGLGGSVRYNDGGHQYTQEEFDARADQLVAAAMAEPVDVLLTHAPPFRLGDEPDPAHVGIRALHGVLSALEPSWHLHGHIHPYGMLKSDRQVGPTTVRNVIPWDVIEITPAAPCKATSDIRRGR